MVRRLRLSDDGFDTAYARLIGARGERLDAAEAAVRPIVSAVRERGAEAVLEFTAKFDGMVLTADALKVSDAQRQRARAACAPNVIAALELAAERIHAFHARQAPEDARWVDARGVTLGWRWTPVDAAGVYAPGGLAAYPSSVLMNAIPAKAAGVARVVMATPPGKLMENPAILAAADIAGVDEIWTIGGAQAIAALAYGAGKLAACDVVVGPGNAYVAAAKKIVFGDVGVDAVAGPSEVFILADSTAPAEWLAADLLAQAEHDADAQSVLFTDDAAHADAVCAAVEQQLAKGDAGASARESWTRHGAVIVVDQLTDACALIDRAAPEHVQIATMDPEPLAKRIRHAGALFLGVHAPEALGDYVAGPSHVLPTMRAARYASGVNVLTFMKRTTIIGASGDGVAAIGAEAADLADAEGLPAHARSVRTRLGL
ncbi:MAG TPA: histidinol dehydrogenase [Caulobacterales bacterium]|nr:histidinol dehydrogenase [Caulobacterales bacterium]